MPDVVIANTQVQATNNTWSGVWKLTRAMKKAGWRYIGSSNGTSKDTTGNPSNDYWGAQNTVAGQTGSAASLTTTSGLDITVTGLTGMSASSVGRFLRVTGAASAANNGTWQIVAYISATSVRIRNASAVASDANNGSISWAEDDPVLDSYPSLDSVAAWWAARGPDVLKIPIGSASTGTFLRGENVTQASTSATGEILGYVYNTASDSFLVVLPRFGTFNGSNVITGSTSGATVTPNASVITFANEVVFWKANDLVNGTIYSVRADTNAESTSLFSALVSTAGCTATIAPGGGGTGNSFPALAYVARGTGGSAAHASWCQATNHGLPKFQISVTNVINDTSVSADGSFWLMMGYPSGGATASNGFAYMRMDDTEDGDLDPFIFMSNPTSTYNRTQALNTGNASTWSVTTYYSSSNTNWSGWRRRGYSTNDAYQNNYSPCHFIAVRFGGASVSAGDSTGNSLALINSNYSVIERVASHPASISVREPVYVINVATATTKHRKGIMRWMFWVPTGTAYDTWDNAGFIQFATSSSTQLGYIMGPWDGTTSPVQQ
jgi:hypothetical protein